jgi:hypothetical protein
MSKGCREELVGFHVWFGDVKIRLCDVGQLDFVTSCYLGTFESGQRDSPSSISHPAWIGPTPISS